MTIPFLRPERGIRKQTIYSWLHAIGVSVFAAGMLSSGYTAPADLPATVYHYSHAKGTATDTVSRSIIRSPHETIIEYENPPDEHSRAVCDSNFRISSWQYENRESDCSVTGTRTGNSILIVGRKGTKALRKTLSIDSLPWYQALEFSLLPFFRSAAKECAFWMIRPTDMAAFKMSVRRGDTASVPVNGRQERCVQVILSPVGVAGTFWKATYWHRTDDHVFLKCVVPMGIPGKAPLVVESIGTSNAQRR
jgi:hypothetical protein